MGYFQEPWGAKSGFGLSFGIQAVIVAVAVAIVAILQFFGGKVRETLHYKVPIGIDLRDATRVAYPDSC